MKVHGKDAVWCGGTATGRGEYSTVQYSTVQRRGEVSTVQYSTDTIMKAATSAFTFKTLL